MIVQVAVNGASWLESPTVTEQAHLRIRSTTPSPLTRWRRQIAAAPNQITPLTQQRKTSRLCSAACRSLILSRCTNITLDAFGNIHTVSRIERRCAGRGMKSPGRTVQGEDKWIEGKRCRKMSDYTLCVVGLADSSGMDSTQARKSGGCKNSRDHRPVSR